MARLLDLYKNDIAKAMAAKFNHDNPMAIPKLTKIVINMGVGKATQDKAQLESAVDSLTKISGQKPVVTKAKVSVSGFRLREGNDIGCKVTLRGRRMYEFLDRLISIALPRIRDFRGVNPNSFDGHGNFSLGLAEQVVFPGDRRRQDPAQPWNGHHDRDHRARTTSRPASCCTNLACRSASRRPRGSDQTAVSVRASPAVSTGVMVRDSAVRRAVESPVTEDQALFEG